MRRQDSGPLTANVQVVQPKNPTLKAQLDAFTADSAVRLTSATRDGAEIPFEVVETPGEGRGAPLYCYRPLTGSFIRARLGLLAALESYAPAVKALEFTYGTDAYLRARGEPRIPENPRDLADATLRCFLARVFAERSEFAVDPERFEAAYAELERSLYEGLGVAEVVAPLAGVSLDAGTRELNISSGLMITRQENLDDPPAGLVDGMSPGDLIAVVRIPQERSERPPLAEARRRYRELITALRLYDRGGYGIGPLGFSRIDDGAWIPAAIGPVGRIGAATRITASQEDEFRGFVSLITRRLEGLGGEARWALHRFELGADRRDPYESLSDYLLALRAMLEPEGTASGRLCQRLSVICALPEQQQELAERLSRAVKLEHWVMAGEALERWRGSEPPEALIDELSDHLRAVLRDVICGHLDPDLRGVADELLAEAAAEV
ncbi:MAG: hypothetical protein J2O48_05300 [Solirubrobacterales bacterium]|nr:hypothetical protein [Solirubrobacterales bacterium]